MPYFIERLADIQENGWAILLIVHCFVYYICKTVTLLYSRMLFSEAELMQRYPRLEVWDRRSLTLLKDLRKLMTVYSQSTTKMLRFSIFLFLYDAVHVSDGFFRPSSGVQNCTYSVRYLSDQYCYLLLAWPWCSIRLSAGSSVGLTNTWRCMCSFELLMMDGKTRLKHVERLTEINKLRNVASCWLYSANILAMHGPMNVKLMTISYLWVLGLSIVPVKSCRENKNTHLFANVRFSPPPPRDIYKKYGRARQEISLIWYGQWRMRFTCRMTRKKYTCNHFIWYLFLYIWLIPPQQG